MCGHHAFDVGLFMADSGICHRHLSVCGRGVLLALLVHHLGFLKIVDKNLKRIHQMNGVRCLFAFIPWKSYLIVAVMVIMGGVLRYSMIPKRELAILYIGIGLALILSSVRYIRIFYKEMLNKKGT